jgi:hypothetical protein
MARFPRISKYCWVWRSGASADSKLYAKLVPCMGICGTPLTCSGTGSPATSRTVGARSIAWVNWLRRPPLSVIRFGHETTMPLRVPPRWEAICLPH